VRPEGGPEPGEAEARAFLRHALSTVAYRGGKALRGAPAEFAAYKVGETSRTPVEIVAHLGDLFEWGLSLARGAEAWVPAAPAGWEEAVERFFRTLGALDAELAREGGLRCPWTRLFQGPIADALTHVGQLTMLRRLGGAAVRGENYFRAEIEAGRVGTEQAAPRREFD
jgi:hypothetical protein